MFVVFKINCTLGIFSICSDDGSCKHVVALIFALADYNDRRTDKNTAVGTDLPCEWSRPRSESKPVKVTDLDYRHTKDGAKKPGPIPCLYRPLRNITNTDLCGIKTKIRKLCQEEAPDSLFLTLTDPPPVSLGPPSIQDMYRTYKEQSSATTTFFKFLSENTTNDQYDYLMNLSQDDPEWLEARKGRITSSIADNIRSAKDTTSPDNLVKKIMGTAAAATSKFMEFGKKYEHVARQLYITKNELVHKNFRMEQCGLFVDRDCPILGASPDGVVTCSCHTKRILEIKCSFKHQNVYPQDVPSLDPTYHLTCTHKDGRLSLKRKSPWYQQVQFQMGVVGVKECDIVFYTRKSIAIIPVLFNETVWAGLQAKAKKYFLKHVLDSL